MIEESPSIFDEEVHESQVGSPQAGDLEKVADAEDSVPPMIVIAGFWRRLFAFLLDGLIIGIPLVIFGFMFQDIAFQLGPWGRLVGYTISILYWGWMDSKQRRGQTLGKVLMDIAVVDGAGDYINLGKSFLRAAVLTTILLLNGWSTPIIGQNRVWLIAQSTIVLGGVLLMSYGLIFNRTTRQGPHDLLVDAYVAKMPIQAGGAVPTLPRLHKRVMYGIIGSILLLSVAGGLYRGTTPTLGVVDDTEWAAMQKLQASIEEEGDFFSVGVNRTDQHISGDPTVYKNLNVTVWDKTSCRRYPDYCDQLIDQIAAKTLTEYEAIDELTGLQVAILNHFELGVANGSFSQRVSSSIEEWRKRLDTEE